MGKTIIVLIISLFCSSVFAQVQRDTLLDKIEKNQNETLLIFRTIPSSLNGLMDRVAGLEKSFDNLKLESLSNKLNLLSGIAERLDNMEDRFEEWISDLDKEAWTEESLGGLFDGRIEPLTSTIGRLNNLIDELRKNRQSEQELTRKELEGIKERLSNLNIIPNLMAEAQENKNRLLNFFTELRNIRVEQQKEFEQWRTRFRPFEAIFNWMNKIIANILWVILGVIAILFAIAGIRLTLAKLFPEIYSAISKTIKFLLFIP